MNHLSSNEDICAHHLDDRYVPRCHARRRTRELSARRTWCTCTARRINFKLMSRGSQQQTDPAGTHLDVALGGGEEGADGVHVDAALDEAGAGALQLVQAVVVRRVHDTCAHARMDDGRALQDPKQMSLPVPSSVLGCSVTQPVWAYSMSCLNTSGSNSSMMSVW